MTNSGILTYGSDYMKKFIISHKLVLFLSLIIITLIVALIISYKHKVNTKPSNADILAGIEKTFKNVNNLECEFYTKVHYNEDVYKYTCHFSYEIQKDDNVISNSDYERCAICMVQDEKWDCSISSSKCFK